MLKKLIYILFMITFGFILSSCGGSSGNNPNPTPPGTFSVTLVSPVAGSTTTSTMPVITLSTSQTVAQNSSGGLAAGSITLTVGSATGAAIPISALNINNSTNGSTITFSPTIALTSGSTYFVNVTNITSTSGTTASLTTNNTFISGSSLTLSVAVATPINGATNIALSSSIQIQSSLSLNNTSSISTSNVAITTSNSTTPIAGTFLFSSNNTIITFTPASPLVSNTLYTVTVSGLTGTSGSTTVAMSGNVTSTFTTAYKILSFAAGSATADVLNSSDGVNWNIGLSSISLAQILIPYASNPSNVVFLATGIGGSGAALANNLTTFQSIKFKYNMIQWATNGNGTIVGIGLITAGSAAGLIYSTNGGISWTEATIPGFLITAKASIAYGNGGFLAISDNAGASTGLVASSANGYVWTVAAAGFQASFPLLTPVVAFVNGYFVTADGATGTNHITYYTNSPFSAFVSSGQNINDTSFGSVSAIGGGQLSGVNYWYFGTTGGTSGSELAYSTTTSGSITQAAVGAALFGGTGASSSPVNTIIFGNGTFVAGARGSAGTTNQLAFSTNGTTWTQVTTPATLLGPLATTTVDSIAAGGTNGSTFVAVSNVSTAAYSTASPMTATSWSSATVTGIPASVNFTLSLGAAVNGTTGVVNLPSSSGAATNTFITGGAFSIPLVSTATTPAFSYTGGISIPVNSIASTTLGGVPMQIAVGNVGVINYSTNNGVTWSSVTSGTTQNLNSIACGSISGSNICVAVGNGGVLLNSTNGTTWTLQTSGTGQNLNTIIFANNMFVAGGGANSGGLLPVVTSSLNGTSWTAQTIGSTTNLGIWSIAFGVVGTTPTFVAVGGNGSYTSLPTGGTTGFIAYNTSATTGIGAFTAVTNYTGAFLAGVSFASTGTGNQPTFVAVGGAAATAIAVSSTSGTSWPNTATTLTGANFPAGSITYAGGSNWVAGSISNASLNNANMFVSSDNANTWVAVGLPFAPTVTNGVSINALTYVPSLNIVVAAYNAPAGATTASIPISFSGILVASTSNLFQWSTIPSLQYLAYGALSRFITF